MNHLKKKNLNGHITMEDEEDQLPEAACLNVAEKIIDCLSDKTIHERYLSLKEKIMNNHVNRGTGLKTHIQKLAIENRNYKKQLSHFQSMNQPQGDLNNWIMSQLYELQTKIIPDSRSMHSDILEDSLIALQKVVDSKVESFDRIRNALNEENSKYFDMISTKVVSFDDEARNINRKLSLKQDQLKQYKTKVEEVLEKLNNEYNELEAKYNKIIDKNNQLAEEISNIESNCQTQENQLDHIEDKLKSSKKRHKGLKYQLDQIQSDCDSKNREIETQRAKQRFGIKDATPEELDYLKQLEEKVAKLINENEQYAFELKRKRMTMEPLERTEVS